MNAQRKTVYTLRQQLLEGRYLPEELDELGASTGKLRTIAVDTTIEERITPLVAQLIGMFADPPVTTRDQDSRPRAPSREELAPE
jgi:preprotein translocase subunit SecA